MNLKFSVILAFLFAAVSWADTNDSSTCPDDLQCSTCLCTNATEPVARGNITTICAHYVTVNKTTGCIIAQRAAYPIQVDTFSSIQLTGGQNFFQDYGFVNIVIQANASVFSFPLTYLQESVFYSTKFSIVIQASQGVIQSVIWDHQCATCSSSDCYKFSLSNGSLIDSICNNQTCLTPNTSGCDPQIYVTWVGSDVNGDKMESAGMRLSRFEQFSLSDLLDANTIPAYVIPNNTNTTNSTNTTDETGGDAPGDDNSGSDNSGGDNSGNNNTNSTSGNNTHETGGDNSTNSTGGDTGNNSTNSTGGDTGHNSTNSTGGDTGNNSTNSTGGDTGNNSTNSTGGDTGNSTHETGGDNSTNSTSGDTGNNSTNSTGGDTGNNSTNSTGGDTSGNNSTNSTGSDTSGSPDSGSGDDTSGHDSTTPSTIDDTSETGGDTSGSTGTDDSHPTETEGFEINTDTSNPSETNEGEVTPVTTL